MIYEKEYIKYLISNSDSKPEIKIILEDYILDNIDFNDVIKTISESDIDVTPYKTFEKSINIDNLLS